MHFYELLLVAVALSMDAFAVAICKGLSTRSLKIRHMLTVGLYFGIFQALMPLIGYYLGSVFTKFVDVEKFSAIIAFVLLAFIGGNMIKEALSGEEECVDCEFGFRKMITLAVATSIDALAVGVVWALPGNEPFGGVWLAVSLVGITTFILSATGVKIGNVFGVKYKSKAELCGGVVLIGIGLKMLLESLIK